MSVINNGILLASEAAAAGGYQISRSLRFNSADSAYLSRTPASAGNRKTWTWAGWVKRSNNVGSTKYVIFSGGTSGGNTGAFIVFFYDDNLYIGGNNNNFLITTQVFRDFSSWYHLVITLDTTQSTVANRLRVYINGVEITTFSTDVRSTYVTQNSDLGINLAEAHHIGSQAQGGPVAYFAGYLADIYFIDGQALDPTSFGETDATTGVWNPKAYTGSYGTNGFRLPLSDNSGTTSTTLGKDSAGSNNWTPNNFSVSSGAGNDSLVDVPTNGAQTDTGAGGEVRGNYCTFNPLISVQALTLVNGNLETSSPGAAWRNAKGTFGMTSGKWYWEHTVPTTGASDGYIGGVATAAADYSSSSTGIWGRQGTTKYSNGSSSTPFGSTTSGDILGFAFDADAGKLWVAQNGTWVGDPAAGTGESWSGIPSGVFPYVAAYNQANVVNFGQRAFAYTNGRSGFKALCTANLPAPSVTKPSTVMDVKLYTGNGGDQTISGFSFSPDFIWTKSRSQAYSHNVYDSVRGTGKNLFANETSAENTDANTIKAFNSNGFQLGSNDNGNYTNGGSAVAWCWDAGTSTVTNTQGSITSSVRANPTAGFSVVTYTGTGSAATVGHGLGVAPSMVIVKKRSAAGSWEVYFKDLGASYYLELERTNAKGGPYSGLWNDTAPTSTVFSIGNDGGVNSSGATYVAYCWAPVVGYSAMGSYTGNGSSDGPFVFTGFRPRWVMIKRTDSAIDWIIIDTARSTYNEAKAELYPNASAAEGANGGPIDINSNGFKLRTTSSSWNTSSGTYIYAAFAESPFNYARAR